MTVTPKPIDHHHMQVAQLVILLLEKLSTFYQNKTPNKVYDIQRIVMGLHKDNELTFHYKHEHPADFVGGSWRDQWETRRSRPPVQPRPH